MARFTELLPIRTQEEFDALQKAAQADNHISAWASHYLRRDDAITGFAGLEDHCPMVHLWAHTKLMAAQDSFSMLNAIENIQRCRGKRGIIIPSHANSTFNSKDLLKRAGYTHFTDTSLYFKSL